LKKEGKNQERGKKSRRRLRGSREIKTEGRSRGRTMRGIRGRKEVMLCP
jgi:hypothetical protein